MVKLTFTLDEATVGTLKQTAARLNKPQSQIVREAVADYAARADRPTERERLNWLKAFDELMPVSPQRTARAVDQELKAIRAARRAGGRRSPSRDRSISTRRSSSMR